MLIYLTKKEQCQPKHIRSGDTFNLYYNDTMLTSNTITKDMIIDWYTVLLFAEEDGTIICSHLMGVFCDSKVLPKELKDAIHYKDLTPDQFKNFILTAPVGVVNNGS